MTSWTEAGPIVRSEGLVTVERVGRLLRETAALQIVTSALCTTEGRYVYRLTVRPKRGALTTLVVDARDPHFP